MPIKSFDEIFKNMVNEGFKSLSKNSISGDDFEKWLTENLFQFELSKRINKIIPKDIYDIDFK